jgi:asparagine synthase (glutamine-hydrolysing)
MCGIAGIVWPGGPLPVEESRLLAMRDVLAHRGPDDAGTYRSDGCVLLSRRLAILDLSERGHMPMASPDGRYQIVYNGEVYNFKTIREKLERRGHRFRSGTDTEVILAAYSEWGPVSLDYLNGMFAFAIWDLHQKELFLARDHLGIKPVYYAEAGRVLYFASEAKALFAAGLTPSFDDTTVPELVRFGFVAGDRTPFAGVRRLLPGHYLLWKDGRMRLCRWWNLGKRAREVREDPPRDAASWFGETFDDAVDLRRISDVPVGVLMSGGLDSCSVAASLAEQAGSGVASFTIGFTEPEYDESLLARMVAARWKQDHHELTIDPDELFGRLRRAAWYSDEPIVHASDVHLWMISEFAKPRVTVLLSGEGADETLGGYVRYHTLRSQAVLAVARRVADLMPIAPRFPRRLGKLVDYLRLGSPRCLVYHNAAKCLNSSFSLLGFHNGADSRFRLGVLEEAEALYPGDYARQAMYYDQHTYLVSLLERNDRMTMAASIECRVPFLDYRLVEGVAALPSRWIFRGRRGKILLRETAARRLPPALLRQKKWGFGVPWGRYLREKRALRDLVGSLPSLAPVNAPPFDTGSLRALIDRFLKGEDHDSEVVFQLVMLVLWHEELCQRPWLKNLGPAAVAAN